MGTHLRLTLNSEPSLRLNLQNSSDRLRLNLSPPLAISGTSDYKELINKPKINGVTLEDDKSLSELGIQDAGDYPDSALTNMEIEELLRNFV